MSTEREKSKERGSGKSCRFNNEIIVYNDGNKHFDPLIL